MGPVQDPYRTRNRTRIRTPIGSLSAPRNTCISIGPTPAQLSRRHARPMPAVGGSPSAYSEHIKKDRRSAQKLGVVDTVIEQFRYDEITAEKLIEHVVDRDAAQFEEVPKERSVERAVDRGRDRRGDLRAMSKKELRLEAGARDHLVSRSTADGESRRGAAMDPSAAIGKGP